MNKYLIISILWFIIVAVAVLPICYLLNSTNILSNIIGFIIIIILWGVSVTMNFVLVFLDKNKQIKDET